jgi:hypothetical protein
MLGDHRQKSDDLLEVTRLGIFSSICGKKLVFGCCFLEKFGPLSMECIYKV